MLALAAQAQKKPSIIGRKNIDLDALEKRYRDEEEEDEDWHGYV